MTSKPNRYLQRKSSAQIIRDMPDTELHGKFSELSQRFAELDKDIYFNRSLDGARGLNVKHIMAHHKNLGRYLAEIQRREKANIRQQLTLLKREARALGVKRP